MAAASSSIQFGDFCLKRRQVASVGHFLPAGQRTVCFSLNCATAPISNKTCLKQPMPLPNGCR